jgi:mannose-6-phosphate isomerase
VRPVRLRTRFEEKVWGATALAPWFPDSDRKIGEVWFVDDPPLPLLIKFLFTSDKLSVQVHPDDDYGLRHENSPGKTEMWHILRAEAGAQIAVGFRETVSKEQVRRAIADSTLESLLAWHRVKPGDTFFTPAGAVHAIGGGIALCEIQQQSDITYRLYDYGRPRELHIEKGLEVADLGVHPGPVELPFPGGDHQQLASCRYFTTERLRWREAFHYQPDGACRHFLIFLEGSGTIDGQPFRQGEAWLVTAGQEPFAVAPEETVTLLRTYAPAGT